MKIKFSINKDKNNFYLKILNSKDNEFIKHITKYKHDLTSAISTLELALSEIQNGYKFNDEVAQLKINTLNQTLIKLKEQTPILIQLYQFIIENYNTK